MRVVRLFVGPELGEMLREIQKSYDRNIDRAFERLVELGFLGFELEESRNQYEFVKARIKAMEENLPLLERDIPYLRETLEQAAVDKERMTRVLDQTSEGPRSLGTTQ
jgi:septation ring formation regulator EzrA